ncbi:forkhead box protein M1 isoform X2 [Scyliorhinus canicula]|nr:forkhead box protein M1 isoform X2 [Scyliorhinus canicula]XP_038636528.1 forkhead box protein M1 isoform X2 [Scyliorhinus canicula]XP_038636529.1 forkhead box protein M1 isoform X2 [Scyliorhinus canicula]XP_038636530.1 forkhead box protein M1 isoform X2 [Scyliorhinus canicula]
MKASPRRPLILKRRKRPLTFGNPVDIKENAAEDTNDPSKHKSVPRDFDTANTCPRKDDMGNSLKRTAIETHKFPERIRIVNHPSMPNTQVVIIPKNADLQSIIAALTAKGKESGSNGPKKFILLSSNATSSSRQSQSLGSNDPCETQRGFPTLLERSQKFMEFREEPNLTVANPSGKVAIADFGSNVSIKKEDELSVHIPQTLVPSALYDQETGTAPTVPERLLLDDSLTNIQWLGKMSTDSLGACSVKDETEKENQEPPAEGATAESVHERPPYSYMAMIQFAINSTQSKRMTLKEIYTWIEDHFPYFKYVAKPGWKNSIRHNLSLHDMFIRQTSHNGKISHWTIRAEANRFLTLDQVVKSSEYSPTDQTHWIQAVPVLVCQQQQKRTGNTELPKSNVAISTEVNLRKMKPLLPRTDSYLVPIQLPVTTSLILQPSHHTTLPIIQSHPSSATSSSELAKKRKRVQIAPKISNETLSCHHPATSIKNSEKPLLIQAIAPVIDVNENSAAAKLGELSKESSSRRKQRHVLQPVEEPVILFPETNEPAAETGLDLGFVSDFQESRILEQCSDFTSSTIDYNFKTPIKEKPRDLPTSSTPSKGTTGSSPVTVANSWKIALTPLKKDDSLFEFSPVRTPCGSFLTPLRNNTGYLSFSSTPFKDFALFESPRELLNSPVKDLVPDTSSSPLSEDNSRRCSRELQVNANCNTKANRSLTEGLVLDTLNDSLSKILLDISFTGLEDEDYELGNMSWSTLIPELR